MGSWSPQANHVNMYMIAISVETESLFNANQLYLLTPQIHFHQKYPVNIPDEFLVGHLKGPPDMFLHHADVHIT